MHTARHTTTKWRGTSPEYMPLAPLQLGVKYFFPNSWAIGPRHWRKLQWSVALPVGLQSRDLESRYILDDFPVPISWEWAALSWMHQAAETPEPYIREGQVPLHFWKWLQGPQGFASSHAPAMAVCTVQMGFLISVVLWKKLTPTYRSR